MTKRCCKCKSYKDVEHFTKRSRTKDGLCPRCKTCDRKSQAEWRQAHPESAKASDRKKLLRHVYGLEIQEYNALEEKQGGVCGICKKPGSDSLGRRLSVDHDHVTGRVRGLLCNKCNRGLGFFQDSVVNLRAASQYLENV